MVIINITFLRFVLENNLILYYYNSLHFLDTNHTTFFKQIYFFNLLHSILNVKKATKNKVKNYECYTKTARFSRNRLFQLFFKSNVRRDLKF